MHRFGLTNKVEAFRVNSCNLPVGRQVSGRKPCNINYFTAH